MFKNTKLNADMSLKNETLSSLGYSVELLSKRSGWHWLSESHGSSDGTFPTQGEAVQDAWNAAGNKTMETLNIPDDTWNKMPTKEQKEMVEEAFSKM